MNKHNHDYYQEDFILSSIMRFCDYCEKWSVVGVVAYKEVGYYTKKAHKMAHLWGFDYCYEGFTDLLWGCSSVVV